MAVNGLRKVALLPAFALSLLRTETIATGRSTVVVIFPLVSLMVAQVSSVKTVSWALVLQEWKRGVTRFSEREGNYWLLFTAPEASRCWTAKAHTCMSAYSLCAHSPYWITSFHHEYFTCACK